MQSFIMNSHEVFIHIHQGCFAGTGAIVRLPQCQWSKPDGYGKISQCITTTKHSKAKAVCIFLGIYCTICRFEGFGRSFVAHAASSLSNPSLTPVQQASSIDVFKEFNVEDPSIHWLLLCTKMLSVCGSVRVFYLQVLLSTVISHYITISAM